jgi:hypothetical protein
MKVGVHSKVTHRQLQQGRDDGLGIDQVSSRHDPSVSLELLCNRGCCLGVVHVLSSMVGDCKQGRVVRCWNID